MVALRQFCFAKMPQYAITMKQGKCGVGVTMEVVSGAKFSSIFRDFHIKILRCVNFLLGG